MKNRIGTVLLAAIMVALTPAVTAWAQDQNQVQTAGNHIEALEVAEQGGSLFVKLTLKEPLAAPPASFSVANPARIAFDFPATANALGRSVQNIDQGDLRSANIVQAGDRTRLVLNLVKMTPYDTRVEGRSVIIALNPISAQATPTPGAQAYANFAEERPALTGGKSIRDINFRRGKDGEGRVVVQLSSAETGIDIRQQGGNLVVDFLKTSLPEHLRRKSDVTDFATPVTGMTAQQLGDNVRLVVTPNGLWEHNAYQSDDQFVLEVKRVIEDPSKLVQSGLAKYGGEKLSLTFQNIDIRSVLHVIADFTKFNIVVSDKVSGTVTLRLVDVPWDQALDVILQDKGLSYTKNGDIIWVATVADIDDQQQALARRRQLDLEVEPLETEVFQVNYHRADEVASLIRAQIKGAETTLRSAGAGANRNTPLGASGAGADTYRRQATLDTGRVGLLSDRGSVTPEVKSNKLFVRDVASSREAIRQFIQQIDLPPRQVLIEARIVEANKDFVRELGVRLGYGDAKAKNLGGGARLGFGSSEFASFNPDGTLNTDEGALLNGMLQRIGESVVSGTRSTNAFGIANLTLFNSGLTRFLNLELSALETDGRGRVISSPRVLTANQVEASIEQGTEIPYQEASSSGATTVSFKKAVLSLKVTPQITPDGRLQLKIEINKDRPLFESALLGVPPIETKNVKSEVLVENGGTVVVGGIYEEEDSSGVEQVPLLGDIPVLGHLFKTQRKLSTRKELLVFITPRIVADALTLK